MPRCWMSESSDDHTLTPLGEAEEEARRERLSERQASDYHRWLWDEWEPIEEGWEEWFPANEPTDHESIRKEMDNLLDRRVRG